MPTGRCSSVIWLIWFGLMSLACRFPTAWFALFAWRWLLGGHFAEIGDDFTAGGVDNFQAPTGPIDVMARRHLMDFGFWPASPRCKNQFFGSVFFLFVFFIIGFFFHSHDPSSSAGVTAKLPKQITQPLGKLAAV